jgi:hypothetical protein
MPGTHILKAVFIGHLKAIGIPGYRNARVMENIFPFPWIFGFAGSVLSKFNPCEKDLFLRPNAGFCLPNAGPTKSRNPIRRNGSAV